MRVDDRVAALVAFLKTLSVPAVSTGAPDQSDSVERGRKLFRSLDCDRCHTPPEYTSLHARDVGLVDEVGNRRFNPPSLRGVSLRSSFLHDGRAESLRDVFAVHEHPGLDLSRSEIDDLVVFLSTL